MPRTAEFFVTCGLNMTMMVRTFHASVNKLMILGCLLPSTVLAAYFFWERMPLAGLVFLLLMVLCVERIIHTSYTFTDDGMLVVDRGRFARKHLIRVAEVAEVRVVYPGKLNLLRRGPAVLLTLADRSECVLVPVPAEEFCHYLLKKKEELCAPSV